jgi:hypothetical protein
MPLPIYSELSSKPEYKALSTDEQESVTSSYFTDFAAENPDQADYVKSQQADALALIQSRKGLDDEAPVQRRFKDAQIESLKFNLAVRDGQRSGKITKDNWDDVMASAPKNANIKFPDAENMQTLKDLALDGAIFTPEKLKNKIGFSDRSTEEYRSQYGQIRNGLAK